jgi:hypothetical protein
MHSGGIAITPIKVRITVAFLASIRGSYRSYKHTYSAFTKTDDEVANRWIKSIQINNAPLILQQPISTHLLK